MLYIFKIYNTVLMTNGTSQGLFIIVAIVIFGIFVLMANTIIGGTLTDSLEDLFSRGVETATVVGEEDGPYGGLDVAPTAQEHFTFEIVDGAVTITDYDGEDKNVVIPHTVTIDGIDYETTIIGWYAFGYMELESAIIPNTVVEIHMGAFEENLLTEINLPNNLTWIDEYAFAYNSIEEVYIPDSVTEIGMTAFGMNELHTVKISNSITEIHHSTFWDNNLTEVVIPDSVEIIGPEAFYKNNLQSVQFPSNLVTIHDYAFAENELTEIALPTGLDRIWRYVFQDNQLTSVDIPDSVSSIGQFSFRDNNLTEINLPSSLDELTLSAFNGNNISEITIPENVWRVEVTSFTNTDVKTLHLHSGVTSLLSFQNSFENSGIETLIIDYNPDIDGYLDVSGLDLTGVTVIQN